MFAGMHLNFQTTGATVRPYESVCVLPCVTAVVSCILAQCPKLIAVTVALLCVFVWM